MVNSRPDIWARWPNSLTTIRETESIQRQSSRPSGADRRHTYCRNPAEYTLHITIIIWSLLFLCYWSRLFLIVQGVVDTWSVCIMIRSTRVETVCSVYLTFAQCKLYNACFGCIWLWFVFSGRSYWLFHPLVCRLWSLTVAASRGMEWNVEWNGMEWNVEWNENNA